MAKKRSLGKRFGQLLEASLLWLLFGLFRLLPLDTASALGGWLGRHIGPRLKWNKIARYNLKRAFPDWDNQQFETTLNEMWDNLGRTFAETPWIGHPALAARIQMDEASRHNIAQHKKTDHPHIFFGAHLANWELIPWLASLNDMPIISIYRHLNNPYVEAIYYRIRRRVCDELHPKGQKGARILLKTMRANGQAGLLVDQKQNDGSMVEFFGNPAPTTTAIAELTLKFGVRLFPTRCVRHDGCHFTAEVKEMQIPANVEPEALMKLINQYVENWVREHPSQWLWVHQRWGKLSELPAISME